MAQTFLSRNFLSLPFLYHMRDCIEAASEIKNWERLPKNESNADKRENYENNFHEKCKHFDWQYKNRPNKEIITKPGRRPCRWIPKGLWRPK